MLLLALGADLLIFAGPQDPFEFSGASFEAALTLQEQVTDDWLAREGVVGTAIGVDGRGHAVLKVYVTSIAAVAGFPQYMVGVEVVTEVTGPFLALGDMPIPADAEAVDPKKNFPRPVPIGVSTGHPNVTAGTIGARVTDGTRVFALSNNHIFAANNGGRVGDNLLPPGIVSVSGQFERGTNIVVCDEGRTVIAAGRSNYSSADVERIKGLRSGEARAIVDNDYGDEVIHRNNLVLVDHDSGEDQ